MHSFRLGLFFIALTTLLLELTLIRIFDFLWYPNMAYMIITLAMFSIGVSGVIVSLVRIERVRRFGLLLAGLAVLMAAAAYFILPALNVLKFDYEALVHIPVESITRFALILLIISVPFLVSGLIISSLFTRYANQIQSLYFWDLTGAATGCVLIMFLIARYSGPGLVVLAAGLALVAAGFLAARRVPSLVLITAGIAVTLAPLGLKDDLKLAPHMNKRGFAWHTLLDQIETSVWDPVSTIDVIDYRHGIKWIAYDGGTQTSYYYKFDGDYDALEANLAEAQYTLFWGPIVLVSHYLKRDTGQEVLVIGAAGGQETKAALLYGASHVDAVEMVGTVVDLAKTDYAGWTGGIYNDPRVNAVRGEGRSFLRSSDKKYDIIQMMSNHTSSSLAAGSGAMAPTYLQTVEAYKEYFTHLKDDGILHINHHLYPRMVTTAARAWQELGLSEFHRHIFVMEAAANPDNLPTMLIRMTPWTEAEIADIETYLNPRNNLHTVVHPFDPDKNYLSADFFSGEVPGSLARRVPYRLEATTDDKPFFNFIRRSLDVVDVDDSNYVNSSAVFLLNRDRQAGLPLDVMHLFVTSAAALLFSVVVLGVPLLFSRTGRSRWQGKGSLMTYFACLGAGFIIIELVFIQMFIKIIGFPTYTYATVVFSLLLGAGIGSASSAKLDLDDINQLRIPLLGMLATIALILLLRDQLFHLSLQMPVLARVFTAGIMLTPVGFFLGMWFPIGITFASSRPEGTVAWCWAMNGLFTVIGGLATALLSVYLGFTLTILLACGIYLIGWWMLKGIYRESALDLALAAPVITDWPDQDVPPTAGVQVQP